MRVPRIPRSAVLVALDDALGQLHRRELLRRGPEEQPRLGLVHQRCQLAALAGAQIGGPATPLAYELDDPPALVRLELGEMGTRQNRELAERDQPRDREPPQDAYASEGALDDRACHRTQCRRWQPSSLAPDVLASL